MSNLTTKYKVKESRVEYIDTLRGISIILMVMGHVDFGSSFDQYIHVFHMPIWFFITGWFAKNETVSFTFVKRKISQLVVPYVIFGVLQYPIWLVFNSAANNKLEPIINLFWINTNLVMPVSGALWFLTCLFFAVIIFQFSKTNIRSEIHFALTCGVVALIGNILPMVFQIRLPWAMDVSFVAVGFMWAGYKMKNQCNNRVIEKLLNLSVMEIMLVFSINLCMCFINGYVNLRTGEYSNIVLFWINAITAIILFWNLAKKMDDKKFSNSLLLKEIRFIGNRSIVYLIFNQLIILILLKLTNKIIGNYSKYIIARVIITILTLIILHIITDITYCTKLKILLGRVETNNKQKEPSQI